MKKTMYSEHAPEALGPYVQGVDIGSMVFLSGQLGIDKKTGELKDSAIDQMKQIMENIKFVLKEGELTLNHVVKTTIFLKDLNDFTAINEVYASFFEEGNYPARSCVQVAKLPKDALVEVECIAVR